MEEAAPETKRNTIKVGRVAHQAPAFEISRNNYLSRLLRGSGATAPPPRAGPDSAHGRNLHGKRQRAARSILKGGPRSCDRQLREHLLLSV